MPVSKATSQRWEVVTVPRQACHARWVLLDLVNQNAHCSIWRACCRPAHQQITICCTALYSAVHGVFNLCCRPGSTF